MPQNLNERRKEKAKVRKDQRLSHSRIPRKFFQLPEEKVLSYYATVVQHKAQKYVNGFEIPPEVDNKDYTGYEERIREAAQLFTGKSGLYIYGPSDSGKSILSAWILYKLIELERFEKSGPFFLNLPIWLDMMRPGLETEEGGNWMRRAQTSPLIVLDDFGVQVMTTWAWERVYSLLNYRRDALLPIIITSNYSLSNLRIHLAEAGDEISAQRLISRINSMCHPLKIEK